MPTETTTAGELEAGLDAIDTLGRVVEAVRRADESLVMLAGVQIAGTQAARNALRDTRMTVLERMLDEARDAVGLERPVPPGQMTLADDA